jgi:hypothetical protein
VRRRVPGRVRICLVTTALVAAFMVPAAPAVAAAGTPVMADPVLTEGELLRWFEGRNRPTFRAGGGSVTPRQLISIYYSEGAREGVAPDLAFVQAILETGWFSYNGSMVKPTQNNFAGMGAYDSSSGQFVFHFPDVRTGVRAQMQHLRIYGDLTVNTTGTNLGSPLAQDVEGRYPPRWRLIRNGSGPRGPYHGSAQVWEQFGGGLWATDTNYASKILTLYRDALTANGYPADAASLRTWHLRFTNSGGSSNTRAFLGRPGDEVLACDWNGNGQDTPGVFRDGLWIISNNRDGSAPHITFSYGRRGDIPLCGDWNGSGRETVGIVRDRTWHLRNALSGGRSDRSFVYGQVTRGDVPVVGDWNGDGRAGIGIIRDGEWHLRNSQSGGPGQIVFTYGRITRGDIPLVGDFNGNGRDGIGIVRGREWHLRNSLSGGPSQIRFIYGRVTAGDVPLMGDWTRDGRSTPAIVR